jgi:hypothetical protein
MTLLLQFWKMLQVTSTAAMRFPFGEKTGSSPYAGSMTRLWRPF